MLLYNITFVDSSISDLVNTWDYDFYLTEAEKAKGKGILGQEYKGLEETIWNSYNRRKREVISGLFL